jgi:ribonuclease Z
LPPATRGSAAPDAARRHLTAEQAATIAAATGVRRLVLTPLSERYPGEDAHLAEARSIIEDVVVARDLDVVPVPSRPQALA